MKFYDTLSLEGESAFVLEASLSLNYGVAFWISTVNALNKTLIDEHVKDFSEE